MILEILKCLLFSYKCMTDYTEKVIRMNLVSHQQICKEIPDNLFLHSAGLHLNSFLRLFRVQENTWDSKQVEISCITYVDLYLVGYD